MSTNAYNEYLKFTAQLHVIRKRYEGKVSEEELDALEDPILDAMDPLWWEMTQEERDKIDAGTRKRVSESE